MVGVEGGRNPTHEIYAGEWWHEKGAPQHEVRVVETTPYSVTYEYPDGEQWVDPVPTFLERFTQGGDDDVSLTGGL